MATPPTNPLRKISDYLPFSAEVARRTQIDARDAVLGAEQADLQRRLATFTSPDQSQATDAVLRGDHASVASMAPLQAREAAIRGDREVLARARRESAQAIERAEAEASHIAAQSGTWRAEQAKLIADQVAAYDALNAAIAAEFALRARFSALGFREGALAAPSFVGTSIPGYLEHDAPGDRVRKSAVFFVEKYGK